MNYQGFDNIVDFLQMKLQELPLQPHGIIYREAAEYLASALSSAGIGDVKKAELERKAYEVASNQYRIWFEEQKDRAEVAERALDKATELAYTYRTQDDTFSCSSCPFNSIFDRCKKRGLYEDCSKRWKKELLRQAEKELQEERKDVR